MKALIEVFTEDIELPWRGIDEMWLSALGGKICGALALRNAVISLIMTNDEYIKEINKKYRKKNAPTDVISFAYMEDMEDEDPFPHGETETEELGDIYISLERAAEQSFEYGVSLKDEVKRLLIHGILHLTGYDHEKSEEEGGIMRAKEDELFEIMS
jgi:probable rRNA maturation factor